jgi:hypothetical protein
MVEIDRQLRRGDACLVLVISTWKPQDAVPRNAEFDFTRHIVIGEGEQRIVANARLDDLVATSSERPRPT